MSAIKISCLCLLMLGTSNLQAANYVDQALTEAPPMQLFENWNKAQQPFQIFKHVYYVGTENLSSILIDTGDGLVLIDGGIAASAPLIKANIEQLGFKLTEIKYILNSHARLDQAGGFAQLKQWSGAKLVASAENAEMLENGGISDFALGNQLPFPPVEVDLIIQNGAQLKLGDQVFTAHLTPGHLPGSTSWSTSIRHHFKNYRVVYADSLFTGGYLLLNNKNYPNIVSDIRQSFQTLNALHADIFLANKADRFNMIQKWKDLQAGNAKAFIDKNGLQRYVAAFQSDFEKQLAEQQQMSSRVSMH